MDSPQQLVAEIRSFASQELLNNVMSSMLIALAESLFADTLPMDLVGYLN